MELFEISADELTLSSDKSKLNIDFIHDFLVKSYWSPNIPIEIVKKAIENSISLGLYIGQNQIGFCRLVSDQATFAYLADVFISPEFQGKGYGKWMVKQLNQIPSLKGIRRWMLATKDAQSLYKNAGWSPIENPANFMEIVKKNPYL